MKKRRTGLIVFLVILAVILIVPVAFYFYLSGSSFDVDDISAIPQRPTLSPAERFRIDASADTMDVRLNKSDTAYIVEDVMELDELRTELEKNEILFDGIGLSVGEGYVSIEMNAKWKGFLPLPVRICFRPECSGSELEFKLDKICLGEKLRLGGGIVRFIGDVSEVTADMTAYCRVFSDMVSASAEDGILTVTVSQPLKWLTAETLDSSRMSYLNDYIGVPGIEGIISSIENGDTAAYDKYLRELEADPSSIAAFKRSELEYSSNISIRQYFLDEGGEMFERLFPGLDEASVREVTDANIELVAQRRRQLCSLANEIASLYCSKGIATDGRQLYNLKAKKEPLSIDQFPSGADVAEWLDTSTLRFVFGHVSETYLDDAQALKKMPVIGKNAFDHIDETQVYVPYLLFISHADRPVMAYEHSPGNINLYGLSRERYESLMADEWIPVVDQRYPDE